MEIRNQNILITGANRGIGRAFALMCAENKARIHMANRTIDSELVQELKDAGAEEVHQYEADLGSEEGVRKFLSRHGKLEVDILFNNAGQLTGGYLETQKIEEILVSLQVNVSALIHMTRAYLPGMLERRKGKIINHSSVAAYMHFPGASVYSASKAAVAAFTHALESELAGTGVTTLLLVTPGVETRMFQEIPEKYGKIFNLRLQKPMPAKQYAQVIREAVLEDLTVLKPHGFTGVGLLLAKHAPQAFNSFVARAMKKRE